MARTIRCTSVVDGLWPVGEPDDGRDAGPCWHARVLRAGAEIDALVMGAALGRAVDHQLEMLMLATPVVVYQAAPRAWVFLTGLATPVRRTTLEELAIAGVTVAQAGTALVLPGPGDGSARWLRSPGKHLAPWQAVVSTVRFLVSPQYDCA